MAKPLRSSVGNALLKSDLYDSLSDKDKDALMGDFYGAALAVAKEEFIREGKSEEEIAKLEEKKEIYVSDDKLATAYKLGKEQYMIDYATVKNDFGKALTTPTNYIPSLDKLDYSDAEKGKFIADFSSDKQLTKAANAILADENYSQNTRYQMLYRYYLAKSIGADMNGDGKFTDNDLKEYISQQGWSDMLQYLN